MIRYIVGTKEKGNLFKDNRTYKSKSTALKARSRAYLTVNESLDILEIDVEYDKEKILRLEQELQKKSDMLAKVKSYFGISVRKNSELRQELKKTREQLEVAEAVLSVQCTDSALAYFKDKQGE